MTPTLFGRLQSRVFFVVVIGGLWTLLIGPVIPGTEGAELSEIYKVTAEALGWVLLFGLGWELLYHQIQQYRWEKDWPTLFGLITGLNEFVPVYILVDANTSSIVFHFATTWIVIWLFANGPMKVVFHRWRYRGGRLV